MLHECRLQRGNKVTGSAADHVLWNEEPKFEHSVSVSGRSRNQKLAKSTFSTGT